MAKWLAKFKHPGWGWVVSVLAAFGSTIATDPLRFLCLVLAIILATYTFSHTEMAREKPYTKLVAFFAFVVLAVSLFFVAKRFDARARISGKGTTMQAISPVGPIPAPVPDPTAPPAPAPNHPSTPQPKEGEIPFHAPVLLTKGDVERPGLKYQRPFIRERLAEFISDGQRIKEECMDDSTADADALSFAGQWDKKVIEFLSEYMGTAYKEGFEIADGGRSGNPFVPPSSRIKLEVWKRVDERVRLLANFLRDVKD